MGLGLVACALASIHPIITIIFGACLSAVGFYGDRKWREYLPFHDTRNNGKNTKYEDCGKATNQDFRSAATGENTKIGSSDAKKKNQHTDTCNNKPESSHRTPPRGKS
ncbi:MAG: hypothetical protein D4S01_03300 [Dehalococcoidia bacterium]|nr:MAG: hypothetical protein D4S01_03300 [Dehalococcoidia bacterium]